MANHSDNTTDQEKNTAVDSFMSPEADIAVRIANLIKDLPEVLQKQILETREMAGHQAPVGGHGQRGSDTPELS